MNDPSFDQQPSLSPCQDSDTITICVVGPHLAGKSALIQRFSQGIFEAETHENRPVTSRIIDMFNYLPHQTTPSSSEQKSSTVNATSPSSSSYSKNAPKKPLHIQLIDTGETKDPVIVDQWIECSDAIVFVHDFYAPANIWGERYINWIKKIQSVKSMQASNDVSRYTTNAIPHVIIANKYGEQSNCSSASGQLLRREHVSLFQSYLKKTNLILWDENQYDLNDIYTYCCARTGQNVNRAFDHVIQQVLDQRKDMERIKTILSKKMRTKALLSHFGSQSLVDDLDI